MNDQTALDKVLGYVPDPPQALVDNWQTAFIWLAMGIIVFALIALFFGIKRGIQGKHVNKGMLPYVKWPLLFASAGFNVFFTYYVFLPAGQTVAAFSAVVMGGVNLAEAYLVRLIIATWRHDLKVVFRLALLFTVPVFLYSLMAAGSSFSTMMNKNTDVQAASLLELQAAQDRIKHADSQVAQAQVGQAQGQMLNALYQTDVRNSAGTKVSFSKVKQSCLTGGYYARNYPDLCNQYRNLKDGTYTAASVAQANSAALATSAAEKLRMANIIKDRPPEISPTLLGFVLGTAAVGFIVSLALESAIIGVGFFEELFIKPTPLPGLVKFANKALDWNANTITQRGLQVDISPSPGTVNFAGGDGVTTPFSSYGWDAKNPTQTGSGEADKTGSTKPVETGSDNQTRSVETGSEETGSNPDSAKVETAFREWVELVRKGQVKPTLAPAKKFISERELTSGIKNIQSMAVNWITRIAEQGIIKDNPEGGNGKPKYILA